MVKRGQRKFRPAVAGPEAWPELSKAIEASRRTARAERGDEELQRALSLSLAQQRQEERELAEALELSRQSQELEEQELQEALALSGAAAVKLAAALEGGVRRGEEEEQAWENPFSGASRRCKGIPPAWPGEESEEELSVALPSSLRSAIESCLAVPVAHHEGWEAAGSDDRQVGKASRWTSRAARRQACLVDAATSTDPEAARPSMESKSTQTLAVAAESGPANATELDTQCKSEAGDSPRCTHREEETEQDYELAPSESYSIPGSVEPPTSPSNHSSFEMCDQGDLGGVQHFSLCDGEDDKSSSQGESKDSLANWWCVEEEAPGIVIEDEWLPVESPAES